MKKPKFLVGQVVLMDTEAFQPFRIVKVYPKGMSIFQDEVYYLFEGHEKRGSCESNLRGLTARERGDCKGAQRR